VGVNVSAIALIGLKIDPYALIATDQHHWIKGVRSLSWKQDRLWQHTLNNIPLYLNFDTPEEINDDSVAYLCETGGITGDLLHGANSVTVSPQNTEMRLLLLEVAMNLKLWNPETEPKSYGLHIFGMVF